MNERIEEFAAQAGFVDYMVFGRIESQEDVLEKFAELIVRECIKLCDQVDIVGADECIDNIRNHFGVE